jgi:hypothetical protein
LLCGILASFPFESYCDIYFKLLLWYIFWKHEYRKKEGLEKVFVDYFAFLPPSIVIRVVNRVDYAVT